MSMIDKWQNNHNNAQIGKFGKQVELKKVEIIRPIYNEFLSARNREELINTFIKLSNFFAQHKDEIRRLMTEREFASLVGFRLEEFVYRVATMMKEKHKKDIIITSIGGRRCKMIIFEKGDKWIGQGCDLAIGDWKYHQKFHNHFFIPIVLIESKRYVALSPQFRDLGMLALKWKEKYPNVKFIVFAEHNDMGPEDYMLMREFWGSAIDDIFFIKEGSRNLERQGIDSYRKDEIERFIDKMDELISRVGSAI